MSTTGKLYVMALGLAFILSAWGTAVMAATNQATDPGGGGVALTASGAVTVNSTALQLVKQVWTTAGACLASSPADATCNGSATTVTVPVNTQLKFVIFVKNATNLALNDVRFQDLLDVSATGFTYVAGSLKYDGNQLDTATLAQIYAAVDAGTVETDAVDAGAGRYASITGGSNLTVGAVVGQVNAALSVAANRTFALEFQARKN
ncbi:MAG: hypothetical protein HGA73_00435 [Syntrophaceae bacterium]|nr:hypothetical protein [Syntrophaceae bacterium]